MFSVSGLNLVELNIITTEIKLESQKRTENLEASIDEICGECTNLSSITIISMTYFQVLHFS